MFKLLVVLSAFVALVAAGGSGDVDDALLARVAQILSQSEGSSGGGGGSGGDLDDALLARVSQIISQNEGSSSGGSSRSYQAPSDSYGPPQRSQPPSDSYGAPSRSGSSSGGGIQIGSPERAQRVAEFDLSSGGNTRSGGYSSGGSSGGYN